jgi:hypothetical protein
MAIRIPEPFKRKEKNGFQAEARSDVFEFKFKTDAAGKTPNQDRPGKSGLIRHRRSGIKNRP